MPEITRFYGIIISMFYSDHNPPHFHVRYVSHKAAISINELSLLDGTLPPRALGLVVEWAAKHKDELLEDWEKTKNNQQPRAIEPLE